MPSFTKLYLTNTAADYSPATLRGAWDDTGAVVTKRLDVLREGGGVGVMVTRAETSSDPEWDVLLYRGVSGPLAAQTISGSLDAMIGVAETDTPDNFHYHVHAYVTQGDSDTLRGTLLSDYREAAGVNEWPNFATATTRGHAFNAAQALASLAVSAGDRLVVEIGFVARNSSATSKTGRLQYGTLHNAAVLNSVAPDYTTSTTGNSSNLIWRSSYLTFSTAINTLDLQSRLTGTAGLILTTTGPATVRQTSLAVLALTRTPIPVNLTSLVALVLLRRGPPEGGGLVGTGINPAVGNSICGATLPLAFVLMRFED